MRRMAFLAILVAWAAAASAFDAPEHKRISNDALKAILGAPELPPELKTAGEELLANAGMTFGDFTVAVDWVRDPEVIVRDGMPDPNWFSSGIAKLYNETHFQRLALEQWAKFHERAIALAADPSRAREALIAEAVALHFLQDFFAPGHLVTPRKGMHHAAAGNFHDLFNGGGIVYAIENVGVTRFHGDGRLEDAAQFPYLVRVSFVSLAEVFDRSDGVLQTCFSKRRRTADGQWQAPQGGLRITSAAPARVVDCDGITWPDRYESAGEPLLEEPYLGLSGVHARSEIAFGRRARDARINVDLLLMLLADDPKGSVEIVEGGAPKTDTSRQNPLLMGTMGLTFSRADDYNAAGLMWDLAYPSRIRPISYGGRVAIRRYGYGDTHPWRVDVGVRGMLGIHVANVVIAVERSHHTAPDGRFRPEYFVSLGGETAFPWSWARLGLEKVTNRGTRASRSRSR